MSALQVQEGTPFKDLPEDVLLKIFREVDFSARRCIIPLVCKEWHQIVQNSPSLWETVVLSGDEERNTFCILYGAGLGGSIRDENASFLVKRRPLLCWFQKHASAISEVTVKDYQENGMGFDIGLGGLSAVLIGIKDSLKSLRVEDASVWGWVRPDWDFADLFWLTNLRDLDLQLGCYNSVDHSNEDYYENVFLHERDLKGLSCLNKLERLRLAGWFEEGRCPIQIGKIPESFCLLTDLKSLTLVDIPVETFPESFSKLIGLTELSLAGIETGYPGIQPVLDAILDMSSLARLVVRNTDLNHFFSAEQLSNLRNLEHLDISMNGLEVLPDMGHLVNLKHLCCGENVFKELPVKELLGLQALEELDLSVMSYANIPESIIELSSLQQLRVLSLNGRTPESSDLLPEGAPVGLLRLRDAMRAHRPEIPFLIAY